MPRRKTYIITWFDPRSPTPCAKSYYRYNCTRTVQGYSQATRLAKSIRDRLCGTVMLWDEGGVREPSNNPYMPNTVLDHWYRNVYWG